jgi:hypothetical protein
MVRLILSFLFVLSTCLHIDAQVASHIASTKELSERAIDGERVIILCKEGSRNKSAISKIKSEIEKEKGIKKIEIDDRKFTLSFTYEDAYRDQIKQKIIALSADYSIQVSNDGLLNQKGNIRKKEILKAEENNPITEVRKEFSESKNAPENFDIHLISESVKKRIDSNKLNGLPFFSGISSCWEFEFNNEIASEMQLLRIKSCIDNNIIIDVKKTNDDTYLIIANAYSSSEEIKESIHKSGVNINFQKRYYILH